ncbi:MAG: PQQ-binding-like beta-propeller repeat protein, partial [Leptospiraceae bacterium]|nr:PQQ-binding-like beta-propeller repeat protein [Leptospiraceae bacterium]
MFALVFVLMYGYATDRTALKADPNARSDWEYRTTDEIFTPRVTGNRIVFVQSGEYGTQIVAVRPDDGHVAWQYHLEKERRLMRLPTIDLRQVTLYSARFAEERNEDSPLETRLILLRTSDGSVERTVTLPTRDRIVHSPFIRDGLLYFVSYPQDENFYDSTRTPGYACALDLATGRLKWKTALSMRMSRATDLQTLTINSRSVNPWIARTTEIVADESRMYFGYPNGRVYAINLNDGLVAWQFRTADRMMISPELRDGTLYFGSGDWNFYALNPATGRLKWKVATGADAGYAAPLYDGDRLYITSGEYQLLPISSIVMMTNADANDYTDHTTAALFAVNSSDGKVLWRHNFDSVAYTPILRDDTLTIVDSRGNITELEAKNGNVRRQAQLQTIVRAAIPYDNKLIVHGSNIPFFGRGGHYRDLIQ